MFAAKRLFIAEKPEAARNLAAGICLALGVKEVNAATKRSDGYTRLSNDDAVLAFHGHMIEPEFLKAEHKSANLDRFFDFLPVVVERFDRYLPKPEIDQKTKKPVTNRDGTQKPAFQYVIACEMIRRARVIVNAGDVDREGQLIVDEMLAHCDVDPEEKNKPVWRLPLVSSRAEDISKQVLALTERNSDEKWVRRRLAAWCRSLMDVAYGMNASMAYQAVTGYKRMSIGRVQTVVVNMVVERDLAIEKFVPVNYFVPVVVLADGTAMRFFKREGAEGMPGFDAQGRIIDEDVARQICTLITRGLPGTIKKAESRTQLELPPMPFSATPLQATVSKRTGLTPKEVEAAAQSLKDRHKAISYVGTDCSFLPTTLLKDVDDVMRSLSRAFPKQVSGSTLTLRSKAWNDSKVQEHHGIVPLGPLPSGATPAESAVFDAVVKRYISQFYPPAEHLLSQLQAVFGKDEFRATRKETIRQGWREVEGDLEQVRLVKESVDQDMDDDGDEQAQSDGEGVR